jgi:hypothetical protein
LRLNRLYGELRHIEGQIDQGGSRESLAERFERLENRVRHIYVPTRNARTLYTLRQHLNLVRERMRLLDR